MGGVGVDLRWLLCDSVPDRREGEQECRIWHSCSLWRYFGTITHWLPAPTSWLRLRICLRFRICLHLRLRGTGSARMCHPRHALLGPADFFAFAMVTALHGQLAVEAFLFALIEVDYVAAQILHYCKHECNNHEQEWRCSNDGDALDRIERLIAAGYKQSQPD